MDRKLALEVRDRARNICEYCRMPQSAHRVRFPVDHIVARQHGGETISSNLALACLRCNSHKGPNLTGIDPLTGQLTPLFDPRHQRWEDHFDWKGVELIGRTAQGRATITVLDMNDAEYVELRLALAAEGLFPPK